MAFIKAAITSDGFRIGISARELAALLGIGEQSFYQRQRAGVYPVGDVQCGRRRLYSSELAATIATIPPPKRGRRKKGAHDE